MTRRYAALLVLVLSLGACATIRDSRINPFNWFGRDRSETVEVDQVRQVVDGRPLVSQIVSLNVDPFPGGAIIRAVGLPPTQGYWGAELVEIPTSDASLVYEFRIIPPPSPTAQSTQRSREVIVATSVSDRKLASVRSITVIGQSNRRSARR